jgi:hypothetical protein
MERTVFLISGTFLFLAALFTSIIATFGAKTMPVFVGKVGKLLRVDHATAFSLVFVGMAAFSILVYALSGPQRSQPRSISNLTGNTPVPDAVAAPPAEGKCATSIAGRANTLIDVVRLEQAACVGESVGPWAHQTFTVVRLKKFQEENVVGQITQLLKSDKDFLSIVAAIKPLSITERQELLRQAGRTYLPTWEELGLDPTINSADELKAGTSVAGQQAQKLVAEGIANMAESLAQ